MAINLLNVSSSSDPTPHLSVSLPALEAKIGIPRGYLTELFALASEYDTYHKEHLLVVERAQEKVSPETLVKIDRLKFLLKTCNDKVSKAFYSRPDANVMSMSEMLSVVEESIEQLAVIPAFFGSEIDKEGFATRGSLTYRVSQGDTLETISLRLLGSPEHWVEIARFNDLDISLVGSETAIDSWIGRVLNIPVSGGRAEAPLRDPSVLDAPIGTRALGSNWPIVMRARQRADGLGKDIEVLNHVNTFMEGMEIRLETLKGTVPDFPYFGSFIPSLIGQDFGELTDRMIETHVITTIHSDPRVKDVVDFSMDTAQDGVLMQFQVTLFNNLSLKELWLGYTLTRT